MRLRVEKQTHVTIVLKLPESLKRTKDLFVRKVRQHSLIISPDDPKWAAWHAIKKGYYYTFERELLDELSDDSLMIKHHRRRPWSRRPDASRAWREHQQLHRLLVVHPALG